MRVKRFFLILAVLSLLTCALAINAFALDPVASGQIGEEATYTLSTDGVLTISGTGPTYDYYSRPSPFRGMDIRSVVIERGITEIGDQLFEDCSGLTSVSIAPGVTEIGSYAFSGTGLTELKLPGSVTTVGYEAFAYCTSLTSVSISPGVTYISNRAFAGSGLTEVKLPGTVTYIGAEAFSGCTGLTAINCPKSVTSIEKNAFYGCDSLVEVPGVELDGTIRWTLNKVTGVMHFTGSGNMPGFNVVSNRYATWNYLDSYIRSVIIDEGITSVGSYSFWDCQNLETVTVSGTVNSIEEAAFMICGKLTDVQLSDGITIIYDEAFYNCTSLSNINIPETMQYIGRNVFYGCDNLRVVTGVEMNGAIWWTMNKDAGVLHFTGSGDMPQYNVSGNNYPTWRHLSGDIKTVIIDEGITSVGSFSFWDCKNLEAVTIPSTVTEIKKAAFQHCCKLTGVQLPSGLTAIGDEAFYACGITSITIPENVTNVGSYAFCNTELTHIMVPDTVLYLGGYAFRDCTNLKTAILSKHISVVELGMFMGCSSLTDVELGGEELYYIEDRAFSGCTALEEMTLPDGIKYIYEEAFKNCTALRSVTLPRGLKELGNNAFEGCTRLETVILSNRLTNIPKSCFQDCTALTDVEISSALTNIYNRAFYGCTALKSIAIKSMACTMGNQCLPAGITVYGHEGTAVQQYAQSNALEFISLGQPGIDCYPIELGTDTYDYYGVEWCPSVSIKGLTEGTDYTVSYKNNINAGTATVVITGVGDIPGTAEVDFTIKPMDLEGVTGGYLDKSAYEYTGQIIVPKLTVVFWGYDLVKLVEGVDYTLTSFGREPGFGKLVVEGIGNFFGSVELEFLITQGQLSNNSFALEKTAYPYTGQAIEPKVIGPEHLVEGVDYTVSYSCNTGIGTGNVILSGMGNWTGSVELSFEIVKKLEAPQVTASNLSPSGRIKLTWAKVDGAEKYQIWRSTAQNGTYILAGNAPGSGFVDLKAKPGIKYFYKVVAVGQEGSGNSDSSAVVSRVAKLSRPAVIMKLNTVGKPQIKWNQVEGAVRYQVYRATAPNGEYTLLKTVSGTGFVDTTVSPGVIYYYKVVAVGRNAEGNSTSSPQAIFSTGLNRLLLCL